MYMIKVVVVSLFLLFLPSISYTRGTGSTFSSTNMDKNCGKTITMNGDKLPGTFFSFSSGTYAENLNCTLTIKASTLNQRIIVVIDKMDIACNGDRLVVYDGKIDQEAILNKNQSQQCGRSKYYLRVH
ncbi:unnamed protein product [Adineta steineri]|uniref:CUB domain-containing protein n=2 Tax=Adineta steineri TaxID=433720 RepID=A0A813VT43_9BILA|nr:unnamed protein product [Adineta steineri]